MSLVFRQRAEELIDRPVNPSTLARQELQHATGDDHAMAGRDYVDVIRLDRRLVLHLQDRHGGGPGENFRQGAGMRRGQMLHQDEAHPGIGR